MTPKKTIKTFPADRYCLRQTLSSIFQMLNIAINNYEMPFSIPFQCPLWSVVKTPNALLCQFIFQIFLIYPPILPSRIWYHQSSRSMLPNQDSFRNNFYQFSIKPYDVTIHSNRLVETIRMNGHIIGFDWEIKKSAFFNTPLLLHSVLRTSRGSNFPIPQQLRVPCQRIYAASISCPENQ